LADHKCHKEDEIRETRDFMIEVRTDLKWIKGRLENGWRHSAWIIAILSALVGIVAGIFKWG